MWFVFHCHDMSKVFWFQWTTRQLFSYNVCFVVSAHGFTCCLRRKPHPLSVCLFLIGLKSIYIVIYLCAISIIFLNILEVFILVHMCVRKGVLYDWSRLFLPSFRSAVWGRQLPQPLSTGTPSPTKPSSENQQLQLHHFLLQGSQQQRWLTLLPQEDTWWGTKYLYVQLFL